MVEGRKLPGEARLRSSELSVGDLARLTGVRASAIRYYEACGLLPAPARRSGRRVYDRGAVARLQSIVTARRLGFSIAELRRLAAADFQVWRRAAKSKALSIRALTAEMNANAVELDELAACRCASGGDCRL
jgi:DNA-binding transcriptional MerR regulator